MKVQLASACRNNRLTKTFGLSKRRAALKLWNKSFIYFPCACVSGVCELFRSLFIYGDMSNNNAGQIVKSPSEKTKRNGSRPSSISSSSSKDLQKVKNSNKLRSRSKTEGIQFFLDKTKPAIGNILSFNDLTCRTVLIVPSSHGERVSLT